MTAATQPHTSPAVVLLRAGDLVTVISECRRPRPEVGTAWRSRVERVAADVEIPADGTPFPAEALQTSPTIGHVEPARTIVVDTLFEQACSFHRRSLSVRFVMRGTSPTRRSSTPYAGQPRGAARPDGMSGPRSPDSRCPPISASNRRIPEKVVLAKAADAAETSASATDHRSPGRHPSNRLIWWIVRRCIPAMWSPAISSRHSRCPVHRWTPAQTRA